jgi:hypothetical protein
MDRKDFQHKKVNSSEIKRTNSHKFGFLVFKKLSVLVLDIMSFLIKIYLKI